MAKRITSERVQAWAGMASVPLVILMFGFLISLGAIDISSVSGDSVCAGTIEDPCLAYITFTPNEDIFLYPSDNWSSTPFYTDIQPKSIEMYRSWGDGWRQIDLTEGCTGSWCGCYWCKYGTTAKYSYAFRANKGSPQ